MITKNISRVGNFTSSAIGNLMEVDRKGTGFGAPALRYIEERYLERIVGRSLSVESNAKPLTWGKLVENRVFDTLNTNYKLSSQETVVHPKHPFWAGSPDGNNFSQKKGVFDIKSPHTLKSFLKYIEPILMGLDGNTCMAYIRDNHELGEKNYWQLVSNAILTESEFAELIVYIPYKRELDIIREMASQHDGDDQYLYKWIAFATDDELPHLPDETKLRNFYSIQFEIPLQDKVLLESNVIKAEKLIQEKLKKLVMYEKAH